MIEVTAESVSVKGERNANAESPSKGEPAKGEHSRRDKNLNRSEFRYGSFHRVMTLPIQIQQTNVAANYRNGILSLTLPKVLEEKDKVVKVTVH
jgi:HSP20 family protein